MNNRLMVVLTISILLIGLMMAGCKSSGVTGGVVAKGAKETPAKQATQSQQAAQQDDQPAGTSGTDSLYGVECNTDSECGEIVYGEKYCFQNGIVTPVTKSICMNPGSIKSYCKRESKDEVEMCVNGKEVCRGGECLVIANLPCTDSDGGKNFEKAGTVFDAMLLQYKDNCVDKYKLAEYYCIYEGKGPAKEEIHVCTGGTKCVTGACIED